MKPSHGFSLIEMIIYIAVLAMVAVASVSLILSLDDLFAKYRAEQLVFRSAETTLERMLSDIRKSETVGSASSAHPGSLTLTDPDGTTYAYSLTGGAVEVVEDGASLGTLTDSAVTVTELRFYDYASTTEFVRVKMGMSATVGETTVDRTFYSGAVLRGSYE